MVSWGSLVFGERVLERFWRGGRAWGKGLCRGYKGLFVFDGCGFCGEEGGGFSGEVRMEMRWDGRVEGEGGRRGEERERERWREVL